MPRSRSPSNVWTTDIDQAILYICTDDNREFHDFGSFHRHLVTHFVYHFAYWYLTNYRSPRPADRPLVPELDDLPEPLLTLRAQVLHNGQYHDFPGTAETPDPDQRYGFGFLVQPERLASAIRTWARDHDIPKLFLPKKFPPGRYQVCYQLRIFAYLAAVPKQLPQRTWQQLPPFYDLVRPYLPVLSTLLDFNADPLRKFYWIKPAGLFSGRRPPLTGILGPR